MVEICTGSQRKAGILFFLSVNENLYDCILDIIFFLSLQYFLWLADFILRVSLHSSIFLIGTFNLRDFLFNQGRILFYPYRVK